MQQARRRATHFRPPPCCTPAQVMMGLSHPNVVRLHAVITWRDQAAGSLAPSDAAAGSPRRASGQALAPDTPHVPHSGGADAGGALRLASGALSGASERGFVSAGSGAHSGPLGGQFELPSAGAQSTARGEGGSGTSTAAASSALAASSTPVAQAGTPSDSRGAAGQRAGASGGRRVEGDGCTW